VIRRATVADHRWIADVAADVYAELGDYGSIIRSWLAHPGVLTYLDEEGSERRARGSAVFRGFTLLGFHEPAAGHPGAFVADLLAIAVARPYQRQGVGTSLLEHAIHLAGVSARVGRVAEMRLTVAETNQVGRRFFASFGFHVLDEDHGHYDGGQRAIRMVRSLP